jgi:hypothetical protein
MQEHWDPRCEPPRTDDTVTPVRNAYRYGQNSPGSASPIAAFANEPLPPVKAGKLSYIRLSDCAPPSESAFLVRGILDQGATAILYGQSNTGKTFLAMDMAGHVAAGKPWGGRETAKGLVVYIAAEAGRSARTRAAVLRSERLQVDDAPFALVPHPIDLRSSSADAKEIVALIRQAEQDFEQPAVLVVIDTLSRAFAGGNENQSDDMGAFVRNLDAIRVATGAAVLVVHHAGKNDAAGARGHSLLRAAVETELEVKADGDRRTLLTTKQRDMEAGRPFDFQLRTVPLGTDDGGEAISSCVVALAGETAFEALEPTPSGDPSDKCLDALRRACRDSRAVKIGGVPHASVALWAEHFFDPEEAAAAQAAGTAPRNYKHRSGSQRRDFDARRNALKGMHAFSTNGKWTPMHAQKVPLGAP